MKTIKLNILYKDKGLFCLLSETEIPNSKKISLFEKEYYLTEEDSLDFVFQTFESGSIFISDDAFIQSYGNRFKKMNYVFINANKYLLIPAKYAFDIYSPKEILELSSKCNIEGQKLSITQDVDIVTYTDKIFSYMGSSQQMNIHIIKNPIEFINDNLYLFNPKYLRKKVLMKKESLQKELNFLEKEIFFRLYYIANLYEGWIETDFIEFNSPFLNKMIGKKSDFPFLLPFYWIRLFKKEIYNIGIKNTIYIAPRINFKIKNLCSLKGLILKDKFQELYIKQQIAGFLLKEFKEKIYTLNLNDYKIYSPHNIDSPYLKEIGVE